MSESLVRALCLEANALRLAGNPRWAERLLARAAAYLDTAEERAFYCRTLALVLWEQARSDEAIALLERSARLYGVNGPPGEQGVCIALLGLLTAEEQRPVEALALLYRGWVLMDRDLRPILGAQVGLSLALGLAEAGEIEEARIVQREVWPLMRSVGDKEDILHLFWKEALVLASLENREESVHLVEGVLRSLLKIGSVAEALLAALDLALLRDGGQLDSVLTLFTSLDPPAEPLRSVLATCINMLQKLDLPVESELTRERLLKVTRRSLRRILRVSGLPLKPVPFA